MATDVEATDVEIIKVQVGIEDEQIIRDALDENHGDIIATIIHLSNIRASIPRLVHCQAPRTEHQQHVENLRRIMDDKEHVFFEMLKNNKKENT